MRNGMLYRRPPSGLPISGDASGFWPGVARLPIPTASLLRRERSPHQRETVLNGTEKLRRVAASGRASGIGLRRSLLIGTPLADQRARGAKFGAGRAPNPAELALLPTPGSFDGNFTRGKDDASSRLVKGKQVMLAHLVKGPRLLLMVTAPDAEADGREVVMFPESAGGTLNPDWVEWLMGWPPGWTACERLATAKFRSWRRSLFASLRRGPAFRRRKGAARGQAG